MQYLVKKLSASPSTSQQESFSGKTKVIVIGLVLAIIGSIISSSYAKDTITNYTGFGMLLAGIATFILGMFSIAAASLKTRLHRQAPANVNINKPKVLFLSVWSTGIGTVLAVIGSILSSAYEKNSIINYTGFGMLLAGICVFVLGISSTALAILRTPLNQNGTQSGFKIDRPKVLFSSILSIGAGTVLTIVGSILAGCYEKESMMNYTGFGMLIAGVAVLSIGISGVAVTFLRNRWIVNRECSGESEPRVILGSIWAIGIGLMLVINGSLIASSYAKSTLMNYAGFGMLLAGTGVFVYGLFETARISAMGYLNSRRSSLLREGMEVCDYKKKEKLSTRLKNFGRNLVKTSAILNLVGVMVAMGLLFFSLW